ncbi:MAG: hypothetical protein R6W81_07630 [Bacteroidales bacterium]
MQLFVYQDSCCFLDALATDNGDQTDMTPFPSTSRKAFNGMALVIVRSGRGEKGTITLTAKSPGLKEAVVKIKLF